MRRYGASRSRWTAKTCSTFSTPVALPENPKGIVHTTGGYLTGVTLANKWIFDMKEDDVFWCAADIGWVTGHTHIVYGPMANGVTQVMYEGTPDWPDK